jgi:Cu/Ag efflux protein CusF
MRKPIDTSILGVLAGGDAAKLEDKVGKIAETRRMDSRRIRRAQMTSAPQPNTRSFIDMISISRITVPALSVLLLAACASKAPTPPPPAVAAAQSSTETGGSRQQEVTVFATVEKVDLVERTVTLRGPDGTTETLRVPPEARNLAQVKKGDEVVATYFQSVAFEVVKPGETKLGVTAKEGAARAELGERPGAIGARVVTIVADIVKLDRQNSQAVLKGPEGKTMTVNVENPENFDKVKVGDRVEITLTEAVAIDVQPAPKRR